MNKKIETIAVFYDGKGRLFNYLLKRGLLPSKLDFFKSVAHGSCVMIVESNRETRYYKVTSVQTARGIDWTSLHVGRGCFAIDPEAKRIVDLKIAQNNPITRVLHSMKVCSKKHVEIVYSGDNCPLCQLAKHNDTVHNFIEDNGLVNALLKYQEKEAKK